MISSRFLTRTLNLNRASCTSLYRNFVTKRERNEDVELFYQVNESPNPGTNKYMFFVHGFLGNWMNWRSISSNKNISMKRHCVLFDQRNHGDSDHHPQMDYGVMSDDFIRLADKLNIDKFTVLGHSMGGKIAMATACKYPDRVDGLMMVDSAPIDYNNFDRYISEVIGIVDVIKEYKIEGMTKKELLDKLTKDLPIPGIPFFIMKNVESEGTKVLGWKSNMEVLAKNLENIFDFTDFGMYDGPAKAILAGRSKMNLLDYDYYFPYMKQEDIVYIEGAGHWVHADKPIETIKQISSFLDEIDQE
ncbi:unnamed protein product [Moneuplotes crassus]|uniref:AB hydrolase-1 domain-containing protein n=1 Tax=Euplotes crassus TaxID=5936 RepID=A0AAD2CYW4_EUPCR|nr:unnamed protein product [Moneuplotes crassus]